MKKTILLFTVALNNASIAICTNLKGLFDKVSKAVSPAIGQPEQ